MGSLDAICEAAAKVAVFNCLTNPLNVIEEDIANLLLNIRIAHDRGLINGLNIVKKVEKGYKEQQKR